MGLSIKQLFKTYESLDPEVVHSWIKKQSFQGLDILDIGCGSGRDAAYMVKRGAESIVAIDKSKEMLELAEVKHQHPNITWVNDTLPNLYKINPSKQYDFILCSAVLMFINPIEQVQALKNITKHLKTKGRIVISVKTDPKDNRVFNVDPSIFEFLQSSGYKVNIEDDVNDSLSRADVSWKKYFIDKP